MKLALDVIRAVAKVVIAVCDLIEKILPEPDPAPVDPKTSTTTPGR